MYVYIHMYICKWVCKYIRTYIHTYIHACMHTYVCMHNAMCVIVYWCVQEAARRCGKEFQGKQEDKSLRSYSVSLLEQGPIKAEVLEEANETSKEADNASLADDGELPVDVNGDTTTGKANSGTQFVIKAGMNYICNKPL